jgi:hypothetical protein
MDQPRLRKPCNACLPGHLVRQARRYPVDQPLAARTVRATAKAQDDADGAQRLLAGLERLRDEFGSLVDDFPRL